MSPTQCLQILEKSQDNIKEDMKTFKECISKAREVASGSVSTDPLSLGRLDDWAPEEYENEDDVVIHFDELFLNFKQTQVHQYASSLIMEDIKNSLKSESKWKTSGSIEILLCKKFSCGAVDTKIPDAHLSEFIPFHHKNQRQSPENSKGLTCKTRLVLEVAFTHESRDMLILELANYLTEFTHVNVAIGALIFPNEPKFRMQLIVLTRITATSEELIQTLQNLEDSKPKKKHLHYICANKSK